MLYIAADTRGYLILRIKLGSFQYVTIDVRALVMSKSSILPGMYESEELSGSRLSIHNPSKGNAIPVILSLGNTRLGSLNIYIHTMYQPACY